MDPCTFLHTLCNVWLFENSQFTSHAMLQALTPSFNITLNPTVI